MKKLLSVLAVLFVLGTVNVFAIGVGPQGGWNPALKGGNGALSLKLDNVPCYFAVSATFQDPITIGLTADWWIKNPKIEGTWGYYYGVGGAGAVTLGSDVATIFVGGRALIGTNVKLLDNFIEIYLQAAWEPGIAIHNGIVPVFNYFPIDLGLRFWF
ncbi:MAG: hypothetical protein IK102_00540 [Treponema sp.]|nr:hypothetical protein [Treponema sp.]